MENKLRETLHIKTKCFLIVNFYYCVLTALICKTITFCKCDYQYRDILDNRDNFVANIEIYFLALSHTPTSYRYVWTFFGLKKVAVKIVNRLYVDFAETRLSLEVVTFQICLVTYEITTLKKTQMHAK